MRRLTRRLCTSLLTWSAVAAAPGHVASAQSGFSEEALGRGLSFVTLLNPPQAGYGYGIAANDLDSDGDPDLVLTGRHDGHVGVYENLGGGQFIDRTATAGLPISLTVGGVSAADFDGDNDLDLFFSAWPGSNRLLRNDGSFSFTDATAAAGLLDAGATTGTCWADFDGDGWLDLYVSNYTDPLGPNEPNRLYRNMGDGTFTEVGALHGVDDANPTFQAVFVDSDRDGDLDLYISNDNRAGQAMPTFNRLWRNDDGQFNEITLGSGANVAIDSMGVAVGDLDNDGLPDLYCTNSPPGNRLLMNQGANLFVDATAAAGVQAFRLGWGTHFLDYDLDGRLDLFVMNFMTGNQMFRQSGTLVFSDEAVPLGLADPGLGYCCAVADFDGDGDLDLVTQSAFQPTRLYMNQASAMPGKNWLTVRLLGTYPNHYAVGGRVAVSTPSSTQQRAVHAGLGFKGSNDFDLHFGLGSSNVVLDLVVDWPSGRRSHLTGVPSNQVVIIDETVHGFDDCNQNLIADADEIAQDPSLDVGGDGLLDTCQESFIRGDGNGDGSVSLPDVIYHLNYFLGVQAAACLDAHDADDDGTANLTDAVYTLGFLFSSGPPPAAPFPNCGVDTPGARRGDLGCEVSLACP